MNRIYTPFFFTVFLIGVLHTVSYGQSKTSASTVLKYLEQHEGYKFSYDPELLDKKEVIVDTVHSSPQEVFISLQNQAHLSYAQVGEIWTVYPQPKADFIVCATLLDKSTSTPLPMVQILLNNERLSIQTNVYGELKGTLKAYDDDVISFIYTGYKKTEIMVKALTTCPEITLEEDMILLPTAVIKNYMASGTSADLYNHSLKIDLSDLGVLPGETDADVLRSLDALPGISTPDSKAGNLIIRGGTQDQTLILFDDIPIYHKGHIFGTLSPFNPAVIDNIEVYRSGFKPSLGGRVGGAVSVRTPNSIPDSIKTTIITHTTHCATSIQTPISKRVGLYVGGRSSYPFNWASPKQIAIENFVFQETPIYSAINGLFHNLEFKNIDFYDYNAKLVYAPSKSSKFQIGYLGVTNKINTTISNKNNGNTTTDSLNMQNHGLSGSWHKKWSQSLSSKISATHSYFNQHFSTDIIQNDSPISESVYYNRLWDDQVLVEIKKYTKKNNYWSTGFDWHFHNVQAHEYNNTPSDSTENLLRFNSGSIYAGFTDYSWRSRPRLWGNIGLRTSYYTRTQKVYFEPRANLTCKLDSNFHLKSSVGLYNQYVKQILGVSIESFGSIENLLWLLTDETGVPVLNSTQFSFGGVYSKNNTMVDLELYSRSTANVTMANIWSLSPQAPFITGDQQSFGLDLVIRKQWKRINTWASYTLSRTTTYLPQVFDEKIVGIWDRPHMLDLNLGIPYKRFNFAAGWKIRSGLAALKGIRTPLLHGVEDVKNIKLPPEGEGAVGSDIERYPVFHQLDISSSYRFSPEQSSWQGVIGLSLFNVYDRKNVIEEFIRHNGPTPVATSKYAMGFAPNLTVNISF